MSTTRAAQLDPLDLEGRMAAVVDAVRVYHPEADLENRDFGLTAHEMHERRNGRKLEIRQCRRRSDRYFPERSDSQNPILIMITQIICSINYLKLN